MQQEYLALVEHGLGQEALADAEVARSTETYSREKAEQRLRYWQYRKLYPIHEFLVGYQRERFDALAQEFGEIPPSDVHFQMGPVMTGPNSPKSIEELRALNTEALVAFLKTWQSSGKWMTPSPEGLGRELAILVASDPERFASEANQFQGFDPTYVRALISGFSNASKEQKRFSWEPVLDLSMWVISQPRDIPDREVDGIDSDIDWGATRQAIADLLSNGFKPGDMQIPFSLRETVWDVLKPLTNDPDPTPEHESQYGGSNMSPLTLSINTVRGEAMHAIVRYALWVRRHNDLADNSKELADEGFNVMPEVRNVLDAHLDPERDASAAIRSIYGQWFPQFVHLDRGWAIENLRQMFPEEAHLKHLRDASWGTYLVYCRVHDDVFDILADEYSQAIEGLDIQPPEEHRREQPTKELAEHLMVLYCIGRLNLDDTDGLLKHFYDRAPASLRAHALGLIGRALHNTKEALAPDVNERLKVLLMTRIDALKGSTSREAEELIPVGWWFSSAHFEDIWSITQLKGILNITGKAEPDHKVAEHLAKIAGVMPLAAVQCFDLMIKGDKEGWHVHGWREHIRSVLVTALRGDMETNRAATDLINRLGAKGFLEFRDLLPEPRLH